MKAKSYINDACGPAVEAQAVIGQFQAAGVVVKLEEGSLSGTESYLKRNTIIYTCVSTHDNSLYTHSYKQLYTQRLKYTHILIDEHIFTCGI